MAILIRRDPDHWESAPKASLSLGKVVDDLGVLVDAVNDHPKGIVADLVATNGPMDLVKVAGDGAIFEDTVLDGVAVGSPVYSKGDGTYSLTAPSATVGTRLYILGYVRKIDTVAADTGCEIEIQVDSTVVGA